MRFFICMTIMGFITILMFLFLCKAASSKPFFFEKKKGKKHD